MKTTKELRKDLAEQIIKLYYASVFQKGKLRENPNVPRVHSKKLKELSPTERKHFLKTAEVVALMKAEPREYVIAQFQAFSEYGNAIGRYILPMPHQLHTLAATVRYQRYKGQQEMRKSREAPVTEKVTKGFFREERRLSGLARMNRCTPDDVLTEKPEEFSKEFLKAKGVWPLVKDVYAERSAG